MTAAKVKTQILHCDHLMNKIIGWRIDGLVDFEYVVRWEVRFNKIATQMIENYAQEKCREQRQACQDYAVFTKRGMLLTSIMETPLVTTKTDSDE